MADWAYKLPRFFFTLGHLRAQLYIHAVLDGRATTPVGKYSAGIDINNRVVHRGPVPLEHGKPFGNWKTLTLDVPDIKRINRIIIKNTSNGLQDGWMEMRFFPR